jgi:hypothetical protein
VEARNGQVDIHAYSIYTEQMLRGARRREVREWVETRLEPRLSEALDASRGD